MAELSTWLVILLLTSRRAVHASDTGTLSNSILATTVSSGNSSQPPPGSSMADTKNTSIGSVQIPVVHSSQSHQDNTSSIISVANSTGGSPTATTPNQQILSTDSTASSAPSGEESSNLEESSTLASLTSDSPAMITSSITHSNDSLATSTKENSFTASSTNSPSGLHSDNNSSLVLANDSALPQGHISQNTSLSATAGYSLSQSGNTEHSSTYRSSPTGIVDLVASHTGEATNTIMSSPSKGSVTTTFLESTSHVSAESSSILPDMFSASAQMTVSTPPHRSTSDSKTSVSLSETTVLNCDAACSQPYQSLLHKYHVTKTTLIAVSVGSGLLILFLLVTIAVLCCTRRTCKQAKAQSIQAESSLHGGSQLYSWHPSLPRPSIRPSVYREVSVEMRENLQRRQRPLNEQSPAADSAKREKSQAADGQVNEGFTSDASVDVPKQPTLAQAGGHKSPPVTFGPVSVVTISSTTPRVSQPTTSPLPTPLPSETKAVTMPRMTVATTSSAPSETQSSQNASAQLDALNGDAGRGQPHKKRRELVYF